jgi:ESF2/ABP1 family protein
MGGRRRGAYYYDLWTLKYLKGFKWDDLTADVAYEKAVRDAKLAAEVSAARRERDFYLSRVDRAKGDAAIAERKRKRAAEAGADGGGGAGDGGGGGAADERPPAAPRRAGAGPTQRQSKLDPVTALDAPRLSDDVLSLLSRKRRNTGGGGGGGGGHDE